MSTASTGPAEPRLSYLVGRLDRLLRRRLREVLGRSRTHAAGVHDAVGAAGPRRALERTARAALADHAAVDERGAGLARGPGLDSPEGGPRPRPRHPHRVDERRHGGPGSVRPGRRRARARDAGRPRRTGPRRPAGSRSAPACAHSRLPDGQSCSAARRGGSAPRFPPRAPARGHRHRLCDAPGARDAVRRPAPRRTASDPGPRRDPAPERARVRGLLLRRAASGRRRRSPQRPPQEHRDRAAACRLGGDGAGGPAGARSGARGVCRAAVRRA